MRTSLLIPLALLAACTRSADPVCFDVTSGQNSATTTAVFAQKHCQGGGVTWAALLSNGGGAGLEFDDEGDAVRVCGVPERVDAVRALHQRLNNDEAALRAAMAKTPLDLLECQEN